MILEIFFDLLSLLLRCLYSLKAVFSQFLLACLFGVLLAGICWIGSSYYSRLWNQRFRLTWKHHVLCGFAAVVTLVATIMFFAVGYTKDAAYMALNVWKNIVTNDSSWKREIFSKTYYKIRSLDIEDFSEYPPPEKGGAFVPLTRDLSRNTAAFLYADESVIHFKKSYPYLSIILWAESEISAKFIEADVKEYFLGSNKIYPQERAIKLAAKHIKIGLDKQVPIVIPISRLILIAIFLIVQSIPLGLIGVAAYRDLKVTT